MNTPVTPTKPQVCIVDGKIAIFLGSDYKFLDDKAALALASKIQDEVARLRRQFRRDKRAAKCS